MKELAKSLILFIIGGIIYVLIELAWRGHSHSTMFFVGGLCFLLVGGINNYIEWDMPIWKQSIIGSALITATELVSGVILNLYLHLNVWDYSNVPLNFLGQICLPFSIAWCFLAVVAIVVDDFLRWKLFNEEFPHYTFK